MSETNDKQLFDEGAATSALREKDERTKGRRRRKVSYLTINKITAIDYKDYNLLRRFINDRGKMIPSRQTGNTAKQQRMVARAVRRAREMALLPFVVREMTDRGPGPRRERSYQAYAAQSAPAAAVEKAAPAEEQSAE